MKIIKSFVLVLVIIAILAGAFYAVYMQPRYVVPILMYHGVADKEGNSLYVSPDNFARQMRFIAFAGYSVISLDELVALITAKKPVPRKTIVITFDDGFEDNYLNAFPVLAKYNMPATFFLITNYIGNKKGYLKWDQVNLMIEKDIDFGGHTRSDKYLPSVKDTKELWEEVSFSKKDIEENTSIEADYFCYPIGGFNQKIKNAVKLAGYKGACTTNRGVDRYNRDVFELNRVKITNSDMNKPFHFRAKLSGYYNLFRKLKAGE